MSKNGKLSLTQKAKVARNSYTAKAFGKALQIDKFEPQMEVKIADMCHEAWAAGYFYAKRENEFIEKACDWLRENKHHWAIESDDPCLSGFLTDDFINDFKNYMKGE